MCLVCVTEPPACLRSKTLTADLDEAQGRVTALATGMQTAQRTLTEQSAAMRDQVANLDALRASQLSEGAAADAAFGDLADGLARLCDEAFVPPAAAAAATASPRRLSFAQAESTALPWAPAARRAWAAFERLESGGMLSASASNEQTLLAAERAGHEVDKWRVAFAQSEEATAALLDELRRERDTHETAQEQTVQQLRLAAAQAAATERSAEAEIAEAKAETAAAQSAAVRLLDEVYGAVQATESGLEVPRDGSYHHAPQLLRALSETVNAASNDKRLAELRAEEMGQRLSDLQVEVREMGSAAERVKAEYAAMQVQGEAAMLHLQSELETSEQELEALVAKHAELSAQAEERLKLLDDKHAAGIAREAAYQLEMQLVMEAINESESDVITAETAVASLEDKLLLAKEQLKEIAVLEDQLNESEVRAASKLLYGCLNNAWICAMATALRRWAYFTAVQSIPPPTLQTTARLAGDSIILSPSSYQAMAASRRTAKLQEMTRVVWASPLGGGRCARALWHWQHVAGIQTHKALLDECKRVRAERDGAVERERQLKHGLTRMREERAAVENDLTGAQAKLQRVEKATNEGQVLRKDLHRLQVERDGLVRTLRETREELKSRDGEEKAHAERERVESRAAAFARKEQHSLQRELARMKAERKEVASRQVAAVERLMEVKREHEGRVEAQARLEAELEATKAAEATVRRESEATGARLESDLASVRTELSRAQTELADAREELAKDRQQAKAKAATPVKEPRATRESVTLPEQLAAAREQLKSQSAEQLSLSRQLKAERRLVATLRQERDANAVATTQAEAETAQAKKAEAVAVAARAAAKKELGELRRAFASAQQERKVDHSQLEPRDVVLQEMGALAREVESLHVVLASPLRTPGRSVRQSSPWSRGQAQRSG